MKPRTKFRDVMPVIVSLTPHGLWAFDLRTEEDRYIVNFPEDLDRVALSLSATYLPYKSPHIIRRYLIHLLDYLETRDAYIVDGDLVRIEDVKPWGTKTMPELAEELRRIYGEDMEELLIGLYRLLMDLRKSS
ncbi:hypothetical protein [Thermococcus paralvinellae]|uniref:Uncharacterized protein n=1 Tax=Thermococcus paralvinellae TaxID=582419 RepID=W0I937_9EURY|nr:hypothetical protein [Thermococcus paralvinellae]AHF80965.1 Hypothetical protein TES1_1589 [Thermococcus paralvinellae]